MPLLVFFAFLGGVVTILSPCILPILPIILSGGLGGGKKRPLGVVAGFILSFTFFTLALTAIVKSTGISADLLRTFSIVVILFFGLFLFVPQMQVLLERLMAVFSRFVPRQTPDQSDSGGFIGGLILGVSLGLLWTPCVGPILASVIALAATSEVNSASVLITLAYATGTGLPMLAITYGGRRLLRRVPWLLENSGKIQKAFGMLMIATAIGIFFHVDRTFQSYILDKFPQYGAGLTKFEENDMVRKKLEELEQKGGQKDGEGGQSETGFGDSASSNFPLAPELIPGGEWFNSAPLTMEQLRGKVVLVDFWTYTCINCIRTFPYLKSWHEKYADKGLVILGVHTPEFEFEKNPDNLQKAIEDFEIAYPVMQDNDYATWRAYQNRYWPAKYFVDKNGRVRGSHFGEGEYNESEAMIRELLEETGAGFEDFGEVNNEGYAVRSRTPETYLGFLRADRFSSPGGMRRNEAFDYKQPDPIPPNHFAFDGAWEVNAEFAAPLPDAMLFMSVEAQKVFLVMRPAGNTPAQVQVSLDGKKIQGIEVDEDKLYTLVELDEPGRHMLKLEFLNGNAEVFAFTFG